MILIPKSIAESGTRLGIGIGIGFGAVIILHKNCITHTHTLTDSSPSTSLVLFQPPWRMAGMAQKGTNPSDIIREDRKGWDRIR